MVAGVRGQDGIGRLRAQRVDGEAKHGVKRRLQRLRQLRFQRRVGHLGAHVLAEELAVVRQRGLDHACLDEFDRRAGDVTAFVGVEEERVEEPGEQAGLARHKRRSEVACPLRRAEAAGGRKDFLLQRVVQLLKRVGEDARRNKRDDQRRKRTLELIW